MSTESAPAEKIEELRGQVEALTRCLERRSRELRAIIAHADPRTLWIISRVLNGLPAVTPLEDQLEAWQETPELRAAEVPEAMVELWRSTAPPGNPESTDD